MVPREYHYDMPFELQADGPYFNLLDFFGRMSRLSRIINVGDLKFEDPDKQQAAAEVSAAPGNHGHRQYSQQPPFSPSRLMRARAPHLELRPQQQWLESPERE